MWTTGHPRNLAVIFWVWKVLNHFSSIFEPEEQRGMIAELCCISDSVLNARHNTCSSIHHEGYGYVPVPHSITRASLRSAFGEKVWTPLSIISSSSSSSSLHSTLLFMLSNIPSTPCHSMGDSPRYLSLRKGMRDWRMIRYQFFSYPTLENCLFTYFMYLKI